MQIRPLQTKLSEVISSHGVSLDEEEMSDFRQIVKDDEKVKQEYNYLGTTERSCQKIRLWNALAPYHDQV